MATLFSTGLQSIGKSDIWCCLLWVLFLSWLRNNWFFFKTGLLNTPRDTLKRKWKMKHNILNHGVFLRSSRKHLWNTHSLYINSTHQMECLLIYWSGLVSVHNHVRNLHSTTNLLLMGHWGNKSTLHWTDHGLDRYWAAISGVHNVSK